MPFGVGGTTKGIVPIQMVNQALLRPLLCFFDPIIHIKTKNSACQFTWPIEFVPKKKKAVEKISTA